MADRLNYKNSGVDTEEGQRAVELIKTHAEKTFGSEVLSGLGGFGSFFKPDLSGMESPVLVAGTDGVGTKLKIAIMMDRHDTVGQDLVAMCVNDIICQGARPLFFLDYIATGKLDADKVAELVKGVADACELAGCALVGGETAEMPGFYAKDDYDMAGFAVGIVDEKNVINGSSIAEGDLLIGLPSSGLHSNGFSLIRKLFFEQEGYDINSVIDGLDLTLGEELLRPTRIYSDIVITMLEKIRPRGIAHITGGGFFENIPRLLPKGFAARIDTKAWDIPPIFKIVKRLSNMTDTEIFSTLNMGIGLILVVSREDAAAALEALEDAGENGAAIIGEVIHGEGVTLT